MVRLAHLSDVHITAPKLEWVRGDWFNKRLAAWFNFRWLGRRKRFRHADQVLVQLMAEIAQRDIDHIIFSGDATALGFASEFQRAADMMKVSTLPGMAVPGNHDYCTVPAAVSHYFEKSFAPWLHGRGIGYDLYPFAQRVGPVWLVGVNSATGNRWAWDAGGAVGPGQRERLAKLLAELEPGPRILVTHFPICLANGKPEAWARGMRDIHDVVAIAAKGGVSLWLHGHRHAFYYFQKPPLAPFPVICGGSATQTGLWTYGEYTVDEKKMDVVRRSFNLNKNAFEDAQRFTIEFPVAVG